MSDETIAEQEQEKEQEAPPSPPVKTLEGALDDLRTMIKAFTVTPQVLNVGSVRYTDPADKEVLLVVSLFRTEKVPAIDVVSELDAEAVIRYRIFASAASEKEGIELIVARMAEQAAAAAEKAGGEGSASAEEGEPEPDNRKTVIVG